MGEPKFEPGKLSMGRISGGSFVEIELVDSTGNEVLIIHADHADFVKALIAGTGNCMFKRWPEKPDAE